MKSFQNWAEFLSFKGSFNEKLKVCRSSKLGTIDPYPKRPQIWVEFVDMKSATGFLKAYNSAKADKKLKLGSRLLAILKQDAGKLTENSFESEDLSAKMIEIITIFLLVNTQIVYQFSLCAITKALISVFPVESDTYVMLSHLVLNVLPKVGGENDFEAEVVESEVFVGLARKFRPKILKILETDIKVNPGESVFNTTMRKLSESWFVSLFSKTLPEDDLLRVWDNLLIYGFDFAHKFALAILSKEERVFCNMVKQEVKKLSQGNTLDALIISANISKNRLLKLLDKPQTEKLIKKVLTKSSYTSIHSNLIASLDGNASSINKRIKEIMLLKNCIDEISIVNDMARNWIIKLENFENSVWISREGFQSLAVQHFLWDNKTVSKFFVTFDQKGSDMLEIISIKIAIAILSTGFETKLGLFFKIVDVKDTKHININEFTQLILKIEENIYNKSSYFLKNLGPFMEAHKDFNFEEFSSFLKSEPFFSPLKESLLKLDKNCELPRAENYINEVSSPEKSPISVICDFDSLSDLSSGYEIEVIGKNSLEVSIITSENSSDRPSTKIFTPKDIFEDEFQIIKDPGFLLEPPPAPAFSDKDFLNSQQKIEPIPIPSFHKDRNCSRLCTSQPCLLF